jgi:hypothetical protein
MTPIRTLMVLMIALAAVGCSLDVGGSSDANPHPDGATADLSARIDQSVDDLAVSDAVALVDSTVADQTIPPDLRAAMIVPYTGGQGQLLGVNAVGCPGQPGDLCTPTEALLVQHDIDVNGSTPQNYANNANSCYLCMQAAGDLDVAPGAPGQECEDLGPGNGINGPVTAKQADQLCLAAIADIFQTGCAAIVAPVCFCGTAALTSACKMPGGPNGLALCSQAAAAYQEGPNCTVPNPAAVVAELGQSGTAVGMADILFNNAGPAAGNCPTCLTKGPPH